MAFKKINVFLRSIFKRSRLRRKFLRFFFFVGIVPLILMGLVSLYVVNRTHRIDVSALEQQLARFKAAEIEKFVGDIVGIFQLRVGFEKFAEIELTQQQFILDQTIEENSAIEEVALINLAGQETAKSLRAGYANATSTLLDQSQSSKFSAASGGNDYFGSVRFTSDGPIVTIASPVYNRNNQIISVLSGEVSLREIQERVRASELGEKGYLYLVDSNGTIIANSRDISIGTFIGTNVIRNKVVSDILSARSRTGLESDALYTSQWGEQVIGSGLFLQKLNWGVVVEWPYYDAQKVVGLMLAQITQFSLGTLVLIFLISSFVAASLIKPISSLKEGAATIGGGNFDYRINLLTGDEIEELGVSLNKMAVSLKQLEELKEIRLRAEYLAESLKKEKELSELKNQFITVASHQLNTPLSVMNWTISAMREPEAPKELLVEGLNNIDQSRRDMLAMVNDLLTLSEIGFRYQKIKSELIDLKQITDSVLMDYKGAAEARKITMALVVKIDDTKADANSWAIKKVIENLVDNAITYSADGASIAMEIYGDGASLGFKIIDQGIGIPEADKPSIFKEFFRAKNATMKKNVGTGLGLFIAKSIVDGHSGTIGFESTENKGAAFYFAIPRIAPPLPQNGDSPASAERQKNPDQSRVA